MDTWWLHHGFIRIPRLGPTHFWTGREVQGVLGKSWGSAQFVVDFERGT